MVYLSYVFKNKNEELHMNPIYCNDSNSLRSYNNIGMSTALHGFNCGNHFLFVYPITWTTYILGGSTQYRWLLRKIYLHRRWRNHDVNLSISWIQVKIHKIFSFWHQEREVKNLLLDINAKYLYKKCPNSVRFVHLVIYPFFTFVIRIVFWENVALDWLSLSKCFAFSIF